MMKYLKMRYLLCKYIILSIRPPSRIIYSKSIQSHRKFGRIKQTVELVQQRIGVTKTFYMDNLEDVFPYLEETSGCYTPRVNLLLVNLNCRFLEFNIIHEMVHLLQAQENRLDDISMEEVNKINNSLAGWMEYMNHPNEREANEVATELCIELGAEVDRLLESFDQIASRATNKEKNNVSKGQS